MPPKGWKKSTEVEVVEPKKVKEEVKEPEVEKVRKTDAQYRPLCFNCGHVDEMHHDWRFFKVEREFRTYGRIERREVVEKEKIFDQKRPCQHACKCQEYE